MPALWAASFRHLLRHPAQLALALVGLSLGVGTIIAVDIATASSRRAFELSMETVNGAATHEIVGGPQGLDERLYVDLRTRVLQPGVLQPALAPIVEGYVSIGDQDLQLVGVDPLASAELGPRGGVAATGVDVPGRAGGGGAAGVRGRVGARDGAAAPGGGVSVRGKVDGEVGARDEGAAGGEAGQQDRLRVLSEWFVRRGGLVMSAGTARQLGLGVGAGAKHEFDLDVGGVRHRGVLIGQLQKSAAYDSLVLTDIAQAQEWLGLVGKLTRIEVRVPAGRDGEVLSTRLRERLPPGAQLHEAQGRTRESLDMTGAFTTNLKAMSLLALLVSTLLIYGAISFAVVQRRRVIGILRALGATRAEVLSIVLTEAAVLGMVGATLGLVLGIAIGRELVTLVSRTINDLYFVVAVNETTLPAASVIKALLGGFGTALAAALLPAVEVASSVPQLGLRRSVLESRAVFIARRLVIVSAGLAVSAGIVVMLSGRSLFAGFAALFMLLLSVAAVTPAVLRGLSRAAAVLAGRASPIARLAFGDVAASLSRTGVAVAALGMAVAAMIGVSIMVESFRESLRDWLGRTMRADVYVTAPGPGADRPERRIEPAVLAAVLATRGIADHSESRGAIVESPRGPVPLTALQLPRAGYSSLQLVSGEAAQVWPEFERGSVIVSEPLGWRLRLGIGDELPLSTASGIVKFRVAGVYREYGNDRGNVLMNRAQYQRFWHDNEVTSLGVYLAPGARSAAVIADMRAAVRGRQALLIRSNADIRAVSMSIFERTFVITRVLYWLAAGVAAVGLVSSLLAWELERSHELAIVRSLGLTPLGAGALIEAQTGFMGLVALVAAIPAGLLTALVLIDVINRRAFGWQIDLHLAPAQFTNALVLALVAALVAGVYPAWRVARSPIAGEIREE